METLPTSRRVQAEKRREQIVDAALHIFSEKGYAGASIRDIARRVGVTEGLMYHYFDSKEQLLYCCWKERAWNTRMDSILAGADGAPIDRVLEDVVADLLRTLKEQAEVVRMWTNEMQHHEEMRQAYLSQIRDIQGAISDFVKNRRQNGEVRTDADVDTAVSILLGGTLNLFAMHGRADQKQWSDITGVFPQNSVGVLLKGIQ